MMLLPKEVSFLLTKSGDLPESQARYSSPKAGDQHWRFHPGRLRVSGHGVL